MFAEKNTLCDQILDVFTASRHIRRLLETAYFTSKQNRETDVKT